MTYLFLEILERDLPLLEVLEERLVHMLKLWDALQENEQLWRSLLLVLDLPKGPGEGEELEVATLYIHTHQYIHIHIFIHTYIYIFV